jgi:hypothetical protein
MDAIIVFVAEVLFCLSLSALILFRLHRLLRGVGTEVCERGGAATEFWLAYTQLMMIIAPALLVAWFSRAGHHVFMVEQLKSSLSLVLIGQFIGLALVGRSVWKSIPRPAPEKPATPTIAPKLAEAA